MTFRNRPGADIEQRFNEIEKELGFENLQDINIETEFPEAGPEKSSIHFVSNGGLWLVLLTGGLRYRVELNSF